MSGELKVGLAAFLSVCVAQCGVAIAKPPVQLVERGVRVEPVSVAPARLDHGRFVLGDWQPCSGVQTRGGKALFYAFDSFGGFVDGGSDVVYANHANAGKGTLDTRWPWDTYCGFGSARWYFGPTYTSALVAEDVQTEACASSGGFAIDSVDFGWFWGGGDCVMLFLTSDASVACENGDPMSHDYYSGVAINFGSLATGDFYYFTNVDGLDSLYGIFVQMPAPGGSYLAALTHDGATLATEAGTQMMMWGTGDGNEEPYRAGTQTGTAWDDDNPVDAAFTPGEECYYDAFHMCPDAFGKMVGFLGLRCPADVNWDGFVNGNDYDAFASLFDVASPCADVNGDGFVNGNDYDAFADWFDQGC